MTVTATTHPLFGDRLPAASFKRWRGELLLVVSLPDGTPGTIRADATDVFGTATVSERAATTLSVEAIRRLRVIGVAAEERRRSRQRPKPWKVVRHRHGADPFEEREWVYSSHTTELAAKRARDKVRAVMTRASGHAAAEAWSWSVVHDAAGVLVNRR